MAKMDDETLLNLLQGEEAQAGDYVWGELAESREQAMREYLRLPYGDEEDGRSSFVTSDVLDTIEWVRPALLKIFVGGDEAVSFEPTGPEDVEGADQATQAVNYVFFKQNNGFLISYTAITDALQLKNCAIMWRWKETEKAETQRYKGLTDEALTLLMQQLSEGKPEIVEASTEVVVNEMEMPINVHDVKIKTTRKSGKVLIEAFPPEELLVSRNWNSPLLEECPYVSRMMRVTLSELREMGFDVEAEDLTDADRVSSSADRTLREAESQSWTGRNVTSPSEDESRAEGWLRIEYVLADRDGDGISERLMVTRLAHKILKVEECSHVPIATASPILRSHRWDGHSLAELVSDLQRLHTVITRQMLDSLYQATTPRKRVLTDSTGAPQANIDDLLDVRNGGIERVYQAGAVEDVTSQWVGGQAFPMLEYVDRVRMNRSGVNYLSSGLDANAINKTATGSQIQDGRMQERTELVARVLAETLYKPMFAGVLKLLTEYGMEKLSFRLRNKFVQYDPQEWRDQYDMSINVGLGTGNKQQQAMSLAQIESAQMAAVQGGGMGLLVKPKHLYNLQAEKVKLAGFQNVDDFWQDPGDEMPPQQQKPDPETVKAQAQAQQKQIELQADAQKFQAQQQIEERANQARFAFEAEQKALDRQVELEKARIQQETQLLIAQMRAASDQSIAEKKADAMEDQSESQQGETPDFPSIED